MLCQQVWNQCSFSFRCFTPPAYSISCFPPFLTVFVLLRLALIIYFLLLFIYCGDVVPVNLPVLQISRCCSFWLLSWYFEVHDQPGSTMITNKSMNMKNVAAAGLTSSTELHLSLNLPLILYIHSSMDLRRVSALKVQLRWREEGPQQLL